MNYLIEILQNIRNYFYIGAAKAAKVIKKVTKTEKSELAIAATIVKATPFVLFAAMLFIPNVYSFCLMLSAVVLTSYAIGSLMGETLFDTSFRHFKAA